MLTNDATDTTDTNPAGDEAAVATVSTDWRTVRLARVSEYEQRGVSNPQPFAALLAAIQGDLLRTAVALEDAVHQSLGQTPTIADCSGVAAHKTDIYLRVVRQVAQNARLEIGPRTTTGSTNQHPTRPARHPQP